MFTRRNSVFECISHKNQDPKIEKNRFKKKAQKFLRKPKWVIGEEENTCVVCPEEKVWGNKRNGRVGCLNRRTCLLTDDVTASGHRHLPLKPANLSSPSS